MSIILMCNYESGSVTFSPERIEGIEAPERQYNIANHQLVLSGHADAVLHHDAEHLLGNSVYRLPTPQEQEAVTAEQAKASQIQEAQPVAEPVAQTPEQPEPEQGASEPEQPPLQGEVSEESQPASSKTSKKASGE